MHEKDVTVDWFFGAAPLSRKVAQLICVAIGWFFVVLPVVILISAVTHRNTEGGWWSYHEGFVMFDLTIRYLGFLFVVFVIGFLALHLVNRWQSRDRDRRMTYDQKRLAQRLELSDDLYTSKYGAEHLRLQQKTIRIEPYGDFETYELRDRYRTYGVG
ncbi:hypothetical protein K8P01_07340 [Mycolicibacterium smegmatis]|nr:hypothetical protein K8P01_07340 [Mycolicibacterium smegmatis]